MSELAELRKKLYWICEDCGCEVDFNENEQNEICPSCGAPAPRQAIQEARSALEQYKKAIIKQQEAERIRQLELFKAEQRAKRNERIVKSFHVIPYAYIFILIAALALTIVHIASKKMDVSQLWNNMVSIMSSRSAARHFMTSVTAMIHTWSTGFSRSLKVFGGNISMITASLGQSIQHLFSNSPYLTKGVENAFGHLVVNLRTFFKNAVNNILSFGESILNLIER